MYQNLIVYVNAPKEPGKCSGLKDSPVGVEVGRQTCMRAHACSLTCHMPRDYGSILTYYAEASMKSDQYSRLLLLTPSVEPIANKDIFRAAVSSLDTTLYYTPRELDPAPELAIDRGVWRDARR